MTLKTMSLSTKQRREQILSRIYEDGHVEVKTLAVLMAVSEATVRRDLRSLADERQLELVYGGAMLPRSGDFSFRSKSQRNIEAKRTIGRLAAGLIPDHETIFIDSGTTSFEMAPYLRRRRGLKVILNSVRLAAELGGGEGLDLIIIGGQYRADRMDTIGPLATSALDQLRGYVAFIGADGLSVDFGVTASDIDSAHLHRLAIQNARETVLLVDHSKLLVPSLYKIADLSAVNRVVTDKEPPRQWVEYFEERGIEVIYPPMIPAIEERRLTGTVDGVE